MDDETKARFTAAWNEGHTYPVLTKLFGISRSTADKLRRTLGLTPRFEILHAPAEFADFVRQPGTTMKDIQTRFGITRGRARRWLRDAGLKVHKPAPVVRESNFKLTKAKPGTPKFLASRVPQTPDDEVSQAAHYLRQFHSNVFRCDILVREGKTWGFERGLPDRGRGRHFVAGAGVVTNARLVEMAQQKGFGK